MLATHMFIKLVYKAIADQLYFMMILKQDTCQGLNINSTADGNKCELE